VYSYAKGMPEGICPPLLSIGEVRLDAVDALERSGAATYTRSGSSSRSHLPLFIRLQWQAGNSTRICDAMM
jgi:hypothetical protein